MGLSILNPFWLHLTHTSNLISTVYYISATLFVLEIPETILDLYFGFASVSGSARKLQWLLWKNKENEWNLCKYFTL